MSHWKRADDFGSVSFDVNPAKHPFQLKANKKQTGTETLKSQVFPNNRVAVFGQFAFVPSGESCLCCKPNEFDLVFLLLLIDLFYLLFRVYLWTGCWKLRSNPQPCVKPWVTSHWRSSSYYYRRPGYWFVTVIYHLPLHKGPNGKTQNIPLLKHWLHVPHDRITGSKIFHVKEADASCLSPAQLNEPAVLAAALLSNVTCGSDFKRTLAISWPNYNWTVLSFWQNAAIESPCFSTRIFN